MSSSGSRDASLTGKSVVVTRAPERAPELAAALEAKGARVISFPTIVLSPIEDFSALDEAIRRSAVYDAIVLGSRSSAEVLLARADTLGVVIERPIACVGAKTLAYVRPHVAGEMIAPEVHRAEALVDRIVARFGPVLENRRFLFPRAPEGREVIIERLAALGAQVDGVVVYRIGPARPASEQEVRRLDGADAFTFLSGETLAAFFEVVPQDQARALLSRACVAVIGPVAKARADALGVRVDVVPPTASIEALVEHLSSALSG